MTVLDLARDLIRAASPSGRERPAVDAFATALHDLGYDAVEIDAAGNAIGTLRRGDGPTLVLNGHLDTVPTGDASAWPVDPLGGEVVDGRLWGRGSVDMKGPLAAMAIAGRLAADDGFEGTLVVAGVVQEEVGGLGARWYAEHAPRPDLIVLGEPSDRGLRLGHRGRIEAHVTVTGRIAHAAKSELGDNALVRAARYALALEGLDLPRDPHLGRSTATLTQVVGFPSDGPNVVPGRAELTIDYRQVPSDSLEDVLARLSALDRSAVVEVPDEIARSEDGVVDRRFPRMNPAYLLDAHHPSVGWARDVLHAARGASGDMASTDVGTWWFATDAPYLALLGAPILGLGPGDPELAHTTRESLPVAELTAAVADYHHLATAFLRGRLPWEDTMLKTPVNRS